MPKMLLVGDGGNNRKLYDIFKQNGILVDNHTKSISVREHWLRRHIDYCRLALYAVCKRGSYDYIFIWQQYVGLYYYLCSLFCPSFKGKTYVFYILFSGSMDRLPGRLKCFIFRQMIHSDIIAKALFVSKYDPLFPMIREEKKEVVFLARQGSSNIENAYGESSLALKNVVGAYYFSGGASNRDYGALKRVAIANPNMRIEVACLESTIKKLSPLPSNMICHTDAYGDAFDSLLINSKAVIIPLDNPQNISGQLVCIQAMQAGKMIFISKNKFIEEWLNPSDIGDFIIQYKDVVELMEYLNELSDQELQVRGGLARNYFMGSLSVDRMYDRFVDIVLARDSFEH